LTSQHFLKFLSVLSVPAFLLAACNLPSTDCARPDVFCVGLVTAYGKVDDHGLNQSAWEGVQQALSEGLIDKANFIETVDARDRAKNIRTVLDDGYDLIVTVGISMDEDTRLAADEWPDRRFIGVDQPQAESRPNLAGLVFPEDQGGFLAGALAALTTQTGKVSALCELEDIASMWRYCEGFREGVRYAVPDMHARVLYKGPEANGELFNDPAWGTEQALFVLDSGVDILFAAGGETARAALNTATARSVYVIGADEDMFYQLDNPDFVLSSAVKQAGIGVYGLIRLVVEGQFPAGETRGEYGLGPYHSLERQVQSTVRERLEQIRLGLAAGSIQTGVPSEP
jgi:basic membrane protein A and related proteins